MHTASIHLNAMSVCTEKKKWCHRKTKTIKKEYIYPNSKEMNIYTQTVKK